jgi:hypothetical protein
MTIWRRICALLIACLLSSMVLPSLLVSAEPAKQGECPGNVLVNPGFEEGFSDRGAGEVSVANGWFPWWQDGPGQTDGYNRRPEYKPEDASRYGRRRVRTGNFAQKLFNTFSTHNGGLYQQMKVSVDSKLTLSAWVQAWSSQYSDPSTVVEPGNYKVYIGIDPTGSTDGTSANVIWSESRMEYNTWIHLSVQAQAKAGTITVFLRGQTEFRTQFNDSYWDDVCLTVVRPTARPTAKPTGTPIPSVTPTSTASPTPAASLTAIPTSTPAMASICVSVYKDDDANGQPDGGENPVVGAVVSLFDSTGTERMRYVTTDQSEPYCIRGLTAGEYRLRRYNASGYASTGQDEVSLSVQLGDTASVAFGERFVPTPTATITATPTVTPTATPTPRPVLDRVGSTIYGISGILLAALALLLTFGLQYLRKRQ